MKRQQLLGLIARTMPTPTSAYVQSLEQDVLGPSEEINDTLSLANMRHYLCTYWDRFDDQLPLLHRPTFIPDQTPDLLLLAVMIVGASMMPLKASTTSTASVHQWARDTSWNLRWQVFMNAESHPPAQLWVIQTLLLLEVHDKLRSSRSLHERAHVYFATTLTLMRRGSTLSGGYSPPNWSLPQTPMNIPSSGTLEPDQKPPQHVPESSFLPQGLWWSHWVGQESARRAALAAFILDATHATVFGHGLTLTIHELNITLPCEENLWTSKSFTDIASVESSLFSNRNNTISFIEGLKRTFNGQAVHTTPFGRIALITGLLATSWQMHQRELDRYSLDSENLSAPNERWRPKVLRALDWWKKDFQDYLDRAELAIFDWQKTQGSTSLHSNKTKALHSWGLILYHIGHISLYITMPELCILAGATRVLGRAVTANDLASVKSKMGQWCSTLRAVNAVYHSLQLIKTILLTPQAGMVPRRSGEATCPQDHEFKEIAVGYSASEDNLLTRPWALYFASLVLWAYSYGTHGPLDSFPTELQYPPAQEQEQSPSNVVEDHPTIDEPALERMRRFDLDSYMEDMIPAPIDSVHKFYAHQQDLGGKGRSSNVIGLLSLVDEALSGTSWELLGEAQERLRNAARMMKKE